MEVVWVAQWGLLSHRTGEAENPIAARSMRLGTSAATVWYEGLQGSRRSTGLWWKAEEAGSSPAEHSSSHSLGSHSTHQQGGDDRQKQKPFPRIFLSGQGLGGTTQPRGGPSPSVNLSRKSHRSTQRRISVDSDPVMLPSKSEQKGETAGRNSDWDGRLCVLGPCLRTSEHIKQTTCYRERQHQQGLTMGRYVQCVKTPG